MEYIAIQKNITMSPRKIRLVADMIRKMDPDQALVTLQFTNKAAALPLAKVIKTALANGNKQAGLIFKKIEVNEGSKLRRYRVGTAGRGRNRPYRKRWSHIKVVLTDEKMTNGVEMKERVQKKVDEVVKNEDVKNEEVKMEEAK